MRLDLRDPGNLAVARPLLETRLPWPPTIRDRVDAVLRRIGTHGTVERTVSEVDDDSIGASRAASARRVKFGGSGKWIDDPQAARRGDRADRRPHERERFDCMRPAQVAGDVPRPQLDEVVVGVVDVGRARVRAGLERVLADVEAGRVQRRDRGVVVRFGDVQREVDVDAAAAALQADLRAPQADPRAVAGHHPDRFAVRPAVHDRQPERAGVERLGRLEVDHFQHEFAHTGDGDSHTADSGRVRR